MLALDVDDLDQGLIIARKLDFGIGAIKLGPRLLIQHGAKAIEAASQIAPVFVDTKYYDIPSTMVAAVRQTFESGATFVTVHASAGVEALKALAELEEELNQRRSFKILCVTVLTSFSPATLPLNLKNQSLEDHVRDLASLVLDSGLTGLVCSAHEAQMLRQKSKQAFLVTPGIRLKDSAKDDQARVMTGGEALRAGASALVVGRPLLQAKNPESVLRELLQEVSSI